MPQPRGISLHVGAVCFAASLAVSGCQRGVLAPEGPIGAAQRIILLNSLAIMLAVVVPTILGTLAVAWWFRASNKRATYRPDFTFSGQIELVVWAVPAMVVLLLGGIAWIGSHDLDPARPIASQTKPLTIEVVSLDWKWLFIYPEQSLASVDRLVIPAGTPISFRLTSASVMNSFFVPQLGSQIYTMAGMATRLNLLADRPGNFAGISAQYSGAGFSGMRFAVEAVTPEAFESWVAATKGRATLLDQASYGELAKPGLAAAGQLYGNVTPGLFGMVMQMTTSPGQADKTAQTSATAQTSTTPQASHRKH